MVEIILFLMIKRCNLHIQHKWQSQYRVCTFLKILLDIFQDLRTNGCMHACIKYFVIDDIYRNPLGLRLYITTVIPIICHVVEIKSGLFKQTIPFVDRTFANVTGILSRNNTINFSSTGIYKCDINLGSAAEQTCSIIDGPSYFSYIYHTQIWALLA